MINYLENNDIVIIDDSIDDIKILSTLVADHGNVRFGLNAADALHLINEYTPEILLLDVELPDMDGISVLKELKKLKLIHKFPVLLSTLHHDPLVENQAYALGASGIIRKPVTPETVKFKVETALNHFEKMPTLLDRKIPVLLISEEIIHSTKIAHDLAAVNIDIVLSRNLDQASKLLSFTHFEAIIIDDRLSDFTDISSCQQITDFNINECQLILLTDSINEQREIAFIHKANCELVYRSLIINLLKARFAHQLM